MERKRGVISKEAFVIGSGPNGLTAAIELALAGFNTTVIEARPTIGGGLRSAELTLPGFVHDVCSAVHPLALSSTAFSKYPLREHGLEWIQPPLPLAHPFDNGDAAILDRSIRRTSEELGGEPHYERIASIFTAQWPKLSKKLLGPMLTPQNPVLMAHFGMHSAPPATWEARKIFSSEAGRALFGGLAAHSALPLSSPLSAAFGWFLALAAHAIGWPMPRGGSQRIANSLGSYFESLGGRIETNQRVSSLSEFNKQAVVMCDVGIREFLRIAGAKLPENFARQLERYQPGPGAFKLDWALSGPIPWINEACKRAGTIHLGGTLEEMAASELAVWRGEAHQQPYVLLVQPSLFDSSRAPSGSHTAWAYCHVPNGYNVDMTHRIEAQIERFAPGFRKLILAKNVLTPAALEAMNPNFTGGDFIGGAQTLRQVLFRPTRHQYRTPLMGVYLCSASTPPGGGVHGMCGYHAVQAAIHDFGD